MYVHCTFIHVHGREGGREEREGKINEAFSTQHTCTLYMNMYVSYGYTSLMCPFHTHTHTLHYKHYTLYTINTIHTSKHYTHFTCMLISTYMYNAKSYFYYKSGDIFVKASSAIETNGSVIK